MKYFYDTEFLEDGKTIDLISIGIVREDGTTYYAVNADANWRVISGDEWLTENVVPHLDLDTSPYLPHAQIAEEVREFLTEFGEPELWAWYAAYDHVVLCQLWGRMIDLPKGIPMYTNDLKQVVGVQGIKNGPVQAEGEHNALEDARHLKAMYEFVFAASDGGTL